MTHDAANPDGAETLVYAERDTGVLLLDFVRPVGVPAPPVVVWLHGGGWAVGDRHFAPDLRRYFARRGLAMASIDYRLSHEALFPAQLHDVRAAVRFLRRHAGELGIDGSAIGLWGSSAGGHLAALAGTTGHLADVLDEPDTTPEASVQAVAEGYGPVDLVKGAEEAAASLPGMSGAQGPEARLLGAPPSEVPERAAAASPLSFVTREAPPFQLVHGTADALVAASQSVLLHEALCAAGVESTLYLIDGFGHGFLNPAGESEPPPPLEPGRLEREPTPAADRHHGSDGAERSVFSFDVVGDFFARHLVPADKGDSR